MKFILATLTLISIQLLFAQIPPIKISDEAHPAYLSQPTVIKFNETNFGIVWQAEGNGTAYMRMYPEETYYTVASPANSNFWGGAGLTSTTFILYFMIPTGGLAQIYDSQVNLLQTLTFLSSYNNQPNMFGGIHFVPTSNGVYLLLNDVRNNFGVFSYYNGTVGTQFKIPCSVACQNPLGFGLNNGNLLLIWSTQNGNPFDTMYQILNSAGSPITQPVYLCEFCMVSAVTTYTNNQSVTLISYSRTGKSTLYFFDSNGIVFGNYTVETDFYSYLSAKGTTTDHLGVFDIVNPKQNTWGISGQFFNSQGNTSRPFVFSLDFDSLGFAVATMNEQNVMAFDDGTYVVTWYASPQKKSDFHMYGQRVNKDGIPVEFNPKLPERYTLCDIKNLKCANSSYALEFIGGDEF